MIPYKVFWKILKSIKKVLLGILKILYFTVPEEANCKVNYLIYNSLIILQKHTCFLGFVKNYS